MTLHSHRKNIDPQLLKAWNPTYSGNPLPRLVEKQRNTPADGARGFRQKRSLLATYEITLWTRLSMSPSHPSDL